MATDAFAPPRTSSMGKPFTKTFFQNMDTAVIGDDDTERSNMFTQQQQAYPEVAKDNVVQRVWNRLNTLKSAGYPDDASRQISAKGGIILFCAAFCYKWYRARFINKIPVWDRQPQWNTVITNREQEKELKAFTCKNCGSTIFIARHRNWFFEGPTGLGGLGCYTCGAKGKDNFIMDRDRIVEDLGDDDDYFDYERPLDFVSAAERRALLKEAGGDEEKANQALVDKAEAESKEDGGNGGAIETVAEDVVDETPPAVEEESSSDDEQVVAESEPEPESKVMKESSPVPAPVEAKKVSPPPVPVPAPKKVSQASEELDILDMDDF